MVDNNKELRKLIRSKIGFYKGLTDLVIVKQDGTVACFGEDVSCDSDELATWRDIESISYDGHVVGVKKDGTVIACGEYEGGECDVDEWTNIKSVYTAYAATYGLKKDGTVVVTGSCFEDYGIDLDFIASWRGVKELFPDQIDENCQLFALCEDGRVLATGIDSCGQCEVSNWSNIVSISQQPLFTVGLRADGTVVACGDNSSGQCRVEWWKDIVQIDTSGKGTTFGITSDGRVMACGDNTYGQCDVSEWRDIVSIASSGTHTVGLRADGTLVACGDNSVGQCDITNWYDIVEVLCVVDATIGVRSDGLLVFAGVGFEDCIGFRIFDDIKSFTGKELPAFELTFTNRGGSTWVGLKEVTEEPEEDTIKIEDGIKQKYIEEISAKRAALKLETRGLASVGLEHFAACNNEGDLISEGDIYTDNSHSDVVVSVACGPTHTISVFENGNVAMDGVSLGESFSVRGWRDIIEVATSGYHAVGLHSFGYVSANGDNSHGKCNVGAWRNIVAVACGNSYTAGLKTDGTVVICGDTSRIQAAEEWTDIVSISSGENHIVGLRSNGTVVACGNNMDGRCNTSGWQNIVSVACGAKHTVAVKADGTAVACGFDDGRCNVFAWSNIKQVYSGTYAAGAIGVDLNGNVLANGAVTEYFKGPLKLFNSLENVVAERKEVVRQRLAKLEEERARAEAERQAEEERAREEAERLAQARAREDAERNAKRLEEEQRKEQQRKAERDAAAKKAKKEKTVKTIVSLIVIAAIAAGGFFLYNRYKTKRVEELAEQYSVAVSYESAGEYADAYSRFVELKDYEDSASRAEKIMAEHAYLKYANASVGDVIIFGKYEQDNNWDNGYDDIEWIVLENKEDKLLLMSKYALDCKPYHKENTMVDWNGSYLRSWLNSNFYNGAFTEEEKKAVMLTKYETIDNDDYGVPGGYDTDDHVFLLNLNQIRENGYFNSAVTRICVPSEYAKSLGAYVNSSGGSWWWLSTPGQYLSNAAGVNAEGEISASGDPVNIKDNVVRPVIWLNTES